MWEEEGGKEEREGGKDEGAEKGRKRTDKSEWMKNEWMGKAEALLRWLSQTFVDSVGQTQSTFTEASDTELLCRGLDVILAFKCSTPQLKPIASRHGTHLAS